MSRKSYYYKILLIDLLKYVDNNEEFPEEKLSELIPIATNCLVGTYRNKKGKIIYILEKVLDISIRTRTTLRTYLQTVIGKRFRNKAWVVLPSATKKAYLEEYSILPSRWSWI